MDQSTTSITGSAQTTRPVGPIAIGQKLDALVDQLTKQSKQPEAVTVCEAETKQSPPAKVTTEPRDPAPSAEWLIASNESKEKRLAEVNRKLDRFEDQGYFSSYPLNASNQYPTLLTRLPIFRPTQASKQKKLVDRDFALPFKTPFGQGRRHGPPLTVFDEDTLIAIARLRSARLYGKPQSMPISLPDIYTKGEGEQNVGVHTVTCTINDIIQELELTDGGKNFKRVYDSVRRLAAVSLELELNKTSRYLGLVKTGSNIQLMHVQWQVFKDNGILMVQFPPVIAHWLEKEFTYLDWAIRKQLNPLGKCLHRFLSSQPKSYENQVNKIATSIGYDGPLKNIKSRFRSALDPMLELAWLQSYDFRGNNRSKPLTLHIQR